MRTPPPDVAIHFPTPNYVDPELRSEGLFATLVAMSALSLIAVSARLYARIRVKRWLGLDDAMIVPALIFSLGMSVTIILGNRLYDWNRHIWDVPWTVLQNANIIAFVAKLAFTLAATFTRLSLICFYYRLIKDTGIRWYANVLHASVAWTAAICIAFIALTIWMCTPVQVYWQFPPTIVNGYCMDEGKVTLAAGILNSVSDLLTTVLPIPIIMRLQMPLRDRIGVCILLCLGFIVTIAGAIRTYYIWKSLLDSWDETWLAFPLWISAAVEIHLAVICACAPALKSLLHPPIKRLSSRLSEKLSSLRSPGNSDRSQNSTASGKPFIFRPLRSLPWFQVTKLDFEKEQERSRRKSVGEEEKEIGEPAELATEGHQIEVQRELGAKSFRYSDIVADNVSIRPANPALQITKRQSVDMASSHYSQDEVPPVPPLGSILPAEWLTERRSNSGTRKR